MVLWHFYSLVICSYIKQNPVFILNIRFCVSVTEINFIGNQGLTKQGRNL